MTMMPKCEDPPNVMVADLMLPFPKLYKKLGLPGLPGMPGMPGGESEASAYRLKLRRFLFKIINSYCKEQQHQQPRKPRKHTPLMLTHFKYLQLYMRWATIRGFDHQNGGNPTAWVLPTIIMAYLGVFGISGYMGFQRARKKRYEEATKDNNITVDKVYDMGDFMARLNSIPKEEYENDPIMHQFSRDIESFKQSGADKFWTKVVKVARLATGTYEVKDLVNKLRVSLNNIRIGANPPVQGAIKPYLAEILRFVEIPANYEIITAHAEHVSRLVGSLMETKPWMKHPVINKVIRLAMGASPKFKDVALKVVPGLSETKMNTAALAAAEIGRIGEDSIGTYECTGDVNIGQFIAAYEYLKAQDFAGHLFTNVFLPILKHMELKKHKELFEVLAGMNDVKDHVKQRIASRKKSLNVLNNPNDNMLSVYPSNHNMIALYANKTDTLEKYDIFDYFYYANKHVNPQDTVLIIMDKDMEAAYNAIKSSLEKAIGMVLDEYKRSNKKGNTSILTLALNNPLFQSIMSNVHQVAKNEWRVDLSDVGKVVEIFKKVYEIWFKYEPDESKKSDEETKPVQKYVDNIKVLIGPILDCLVPSTSGQPDS